jgi:hypothetical protein
MVCYIWFFLITSFPATGVYAYYALLEMLLYSHYENIKGQGVVCQGKMDHKIWYWRPLSLMPQAGPFLGRARAVLANPRY